MATNNRDPTSRMQEHFLRVTQLRHWGTIRESVDLCRARGYFTPIFHATAVAHMECIHVARGQESPPPLRQWPV